MRNEPQTFGFRLDALPLSYKDSVVSEAITKFIHAERVSYMNF